MRPTAAAVGGFIDAVAYRQIGTLEPFSAAGVDNLRVGGRNRERADRAGGLAVEYRSPGMAYVRSFPNAAIVGPDVEHVGLRGNACGSHCAPAAERSDAAPAKTRVQRRRELLCRERAGQQEKKDRNAAHVLSVRIPGRHGATLTRAAANKKAHQT